MSASQKLLIAGGLFLALWGMSYGLYYALFDEHQTLERIGERLATGFARAAENQRGEAHTALDEYAAAKFGYVREVDVHSHWSGLALLLILLGLIFDQLAYPERTRFSLALLLVGGSVLFPLGVILQTVGVGTLAQALAVAGSGLLILALGAVAVGLAHKRSAPQPGRIAGAEGWRGVGDRP